jgi:hypothetical protein
MAADRLKARHHQRRLGCVRRSAVMISDDRPYRDSYQFVRRISFTQVSNAFYLGSPRVYVGGVPLKKGLDCQSGLGALGMSSSS